MFTVLWKIPGGGEEIYSAPSVAKMVEAEKLSDELDCGGREHIAFQQLTAVQGHDVLQLRRTVIDFGEVYVMNGDGKTVATYRFGPDPREPRILLAA